MTLPTPHQFETRFDQAWPAHSWCDSHVVLAVSGGADSVAMMCAAAALKHRCGGTGRLFVAHLNHALRGVDSDADAEWLRVVCKRLEIPLEIGNADVATIAERQGNGLEAAARTARYDFLQVAAERLGTRFVAVGHTADDQIETVLHRILRGTGITGLRGIPASRPLSPCVALIRPLLAVRRCEVLDYLAAIGQDFRTDASNADPSWTRNRLRNELLPALRDYYNADVDTALLRLAAQAGETQAFIAGIAAQFLSEGATIEFGPPPAANESRLARCIRIDGRRLTDQSAFIVREVCKAAWQVAGWPQQAMGFDQWQQLAELIGGEINARAVNLPGGVRAHLEGGDLILQLSGLP
jgi:tRNA(Ile)-lysidine synthase